MKWEKADEISHKVKELVGRIDEFSHIRADRIFCYMSRDAKTRAYARIWSFPKIFQDALAVDPAYVIEIVSEKYNRLSNEDKTKVIIHELLHIPKNFSGSLLPHKYGNKTTEKEVKRLYKQFI